MTDAKAPILWLPDVKRANPLEKTLILGKTESRRRERQMMRWLDGIADSMDMSLSKTLGVGDGQETWHAAVHGIAKGCTQQSS